MKENNKFLFETGRLENLKLQGAELSISASTSVITSLDLLSLGLNELVEVLALFLETGQLSRGYLLVEKESSFSASSVIIFYLTP